MAAVRIRPAGERSLLVDLDSMPAVHALWSALRDDPPEGTDDIVAGAASVLVTMRAGCQCRAAAARIRSLLQGEAPGRVDVAEVVIPVVYDGPDLEELAAIAGMEPADAVRLHSGVTYTVAFLGFSPGFAYLAGAPAELHVPRLDTPRTAVPAGSVALAAGMTAVYPQPTPGGWRLIGRTDVAMFDPGRPDPSLLRPGDRVRFRPVARVGWPGPPVAAAPAPAGEAYLLVVDPGPFTTVQDLGRPGWAHLGVPCSGAADRSAAAEANRLVGNRPGAAVLEATLAGPSLRMGDARMVAVTGARADIRVDGMPARQDAALRLGRGAELVIDRFRVGARCYVAVEGGLAVPPVLGSRSTDTLSGIGPPVVRPGTRIPLGDAADRPEVQGAPGPAPSARPGAGGDAITVTAYAGPRDDWVGPAGLRTLGAAPFVVAASSDRTGLRLRGPTVTVDRKAQLRSEGMVAGSVQVPPDGQPIVLLRNHPTTGGYPVAAVVVDADVDLLAQARPGTTVRFRLTRRPARTPS